MDQQATITIPGWVWLLLISVIFILAMWRMVRTVGATDLFLLGDDRGVNEWARLFVFSMMAGVPAVCVGVTVDHLF